MSYIPNCREDENYNQKYLTGDDKEFVRGYDWCTERDLMYFVCDTSELLKGDILKRYQAYKTGLECNVLQIDEARYKEDLPPLGLNWIKLGLQDVLYDPKTKVIYTPNMNQSMQMSESKVNFGNDEVDNSGQSGIMEERDYIQNPDTGKMEGSTGEGASGGSDSGGQEGASGQSGSKPVVIKELDKPLVITDAQLGKKIGKHSGEWGIDPQKPEDREKFKAIIGDIVQHHDKPVKIGEWRGQSQDTLFFIKGEDVVVTRQDGRFVTILKGGTSNGRVKDAREF